MLALFFQAPPFSSLWTVVLLLIYMLAFQQYAIRQHMCWTNLMAMQEGWNKQPILALLSHGTFLRAHLSTTSGHSFQILLMFWGNELRQHQETWQTNKLLMGGWAKTAGQQNRTGVRVTWRMSTIISQIKILLTRQLAIKKTGQHS